MKIKWGAFMVDGRGQIGGQVASKNRSGAYMRNKVTPANPNSTAQVAVRNMLATASSSWSLLTAVQRTAWDSASQDWSSTNIFGDGVLPTGKNLFTKLNINLMNVGSTMISDVPAKVSVPVIIATDIIMDLSNQTIFIDPIVVEVGYSYLFSATAVQSSGTSFFKGKFRNIAVIPNPTAGQTDLYQAYVERFGIPEVGANVQVEIKLVNTTTGQAGLPVTFPLQVIA
jgi:hypothetical protein